MSRRIRRNGVCTSARNGTSPTNRLRLVSNRRTVCGRYHCWFGGAFVAGSRHPNGELPGQPVEPLPPRLVTILAGEEGETKREEKRGCDVAYSALKQRQAYKAHAESEHKADPELYVVEVLPLHRARPTRKQQTTACGLVEGSLWPAPHRGKSARCWLGAVIRLGSGASSETSSCNAKKGGLDSLGNGPGGDSNRWNWASNGRSVVLVHSRTRRPVCGTRERHDHGGSVDSARSRRHFRTRP